MSSAILPGWVGVNARDAAAERLGLDVQIDNDANLGALAEHRHGAGRGHADMVFVKVSSGVGAGLIINDALFRGAAGTSGEIGHLTLDDQGPLCRCGSRGCLEAYAAVGHGALDDGRADARRRPSTTWSRPRTRATSPRCASSRTPGCTSAGGSPR